MRGPAAMADSALWDLSEVSAPVTVTAHDDEILSVAFSADGRWLVSGGARPDRQDLGRGPALPAPDLRAVTTRWKRP